MEILVIVWTAYFALGILSTVYYVDRPRPMITGGVAIVTTITNGAMIWSLWYLYNHAH